MRCSWRTFFERYNSESKRYGSLCRQVFALTSSPRITNRTLSRLDFITTFYFETGQLCIILLSSLIAVMAIASQRTQQIRIRCDANINPKPCEYHQSARDLVHSKPSPPRAVLSRPPPHRGMAPILRATDTHERWRRAMARELVRAPYARREGTAPFAAQCPAEPELGLKGVECGRPGEPRHNESTHGSDPDIEMALDLQPE
ncbi:MAG: hypothetical protein ACI8W3_001679 [Myxococcota bacterium]|jgi:hypothetical protein